MRVVTGMRLVMAETNVAEVRARLAMYRFCDSDPLQYMLHFSHAHYYIHI